VPNTGRDKRCSDHGVCDPDGDACKCIEGYYGVMCHVACTSLANCSGHGSCSVTYVGLSVETNVYCACAPGYKPDNASSTGGVAGCVLIGLVSAELPLEMIVAMAVGIPAVLGMCAVAVVFMVSISRSRQRMKMIKKDITEFTISYDAMNALEDDEEDDGGGDNEKMEVQADLCIPLAPAGFAVSLSETPFPLVVQEVQLEIARTNLAGAASRAAPPKRSLLYPTPSTRDTPMILGPVATSTVLQRHDQGIIEDEPSGDAEFVPPDAVLKRVAPPVEDGRADRIKAARASRQSSTKTSMAKAP